MCRLLFATLLTGLLLVPVCLTAASREDTLLVDGWQFKSGDPAHAESPNFKTSTWTNVSLPHCWGWELAQQGKKYLCGPGWYRRELDVTPQPGHRYFLRFEAAGSVADVYLNGAFLGEHRGAFGAFCFEITTNLSAHGTNLLAVRVDNTEQKDIAPLSGDFPLYGGLYRSVHLIETADRVFTLTDHASPGVAWLQTSVTATQAVLEVNVQISNGTTNRQALTLVASVRDATGHVVASSEQPVTLQSSVTEPFSLPVTVPQPHLWNGRPDPYLYQAVVELHSTNEVVDVVTQALGLRTFYVDPDKGFFLNGQPYHLHGVNRHQDRPDKGWAISQADQDEDLALLKEMGATAVRCSHYQYSDYFYQLCDQAGILVWAEIPQVDRISAGEKFAATSREQLLDLIRQNINHSSIFCWSLFNELRPGNPDPHRELQDLKIVANGEDPTRPTIAATCTPGWPQMNKIPDLLGWNIYPGWYSEWGTLKELSYLEKYRKTSRHGGFCISEYGAGANINHHEDPPHLPQKTTGAWHPEEWQAVVHEAAWQEFKSRPYIWGTFVWNLTDFTSYWRHEGGIPGLNTKGLVTADRKVKKDAFYFYQANWSSEPMLHLNSRRFTARTNAVTDVKVYSNATQAELFLNGTSQGWQTNNGNGTFIWKGVTLKPGKNQVEARAALSGKNLADQCEWTLKPAHH
jgi:beta-galactosidase